MLRITKTFLQKVAGISLSATLLAFTTSATAETLLNKEQAKKINKEFVEAMKAKDLSIIRKYMYDGTKITVDLDPEKGKGEKELTLEKYIDFTKRSIEKMGPAGIDTQLVSLSVNEGRNQATITLKIKVVTKNMGNNFKFVSTKKTVLGIVDEEVKILSSKDHLISIESL
jgi:septum formation topological specificity factor MinE